MNRTHVEDVKDSVEVLIPCCDFVLVALGEDESSERVPFAQLGDISLDLGQGSAVKTSTIRFRS